MHFKLIYILFISLTLIACRKDDDNEMKSVYYGYEYAPLIVGNTKIYQVDSIVYDDFDILLSIDSFSYKVKEVLMSEFLDASNRTSYKVGRYLQMDSSQSWKLDRVFNLTKTQRRIEKLDDNLSTIPLIFPVKEGESWDANALNVHSQQDYEYEDVHFSYSLGQLNFDSCTKVLQLKKENLLQQYHKEEVYAKGIGLVEKVSKMIDTDLQGNIKNGLELRYRLISY